MKHLLLILVGASISWTPLHSQVSYLDRQDLLDKVELCLQHTYGFSFENARSILAELSATTPGHPAPVFLEALIVYWENFPLTPDKEASSRFIDLMDRSISLSKELREHENTYTEGVFFDLFGRAFKAMFWADNGKSGKLLPDLGPMYRYTKLGFSLKEEFVEFYFSTGLYNYYIEAYPEAHPSYKPLLAFMHKGDRQLGLQQLNYAINHAVYLKVEAILFMSLIQLNYEKDLNSAAIYAERLNRDYPENIFYQGHLLIILLHQHRFEKVREMLRTNADQRDSYSEMIRSLAEAFLADQELNQLNLARSGYLETIEMAENFGPIADIYKAISYMGLSRLYGKQGLLNESDSYARKASRLTNYAFILDEQNPVTR